MSILDKFRQATAAGRLFEEQLYEQVAAELKHGIRREGIWAKAIADSYGMEEKAKALYLKYRVQAIKDETEIANGLMQRAVEPAESNELKRTREDAKVCVAELKTRGYSVELHRDGFWIVYAPDGSCTHIEDVAHLLQYARQVS